MNSLSNLQRRRRDDELEWWRPRPRYFAVVAFLALFAVGSVTGFHLLDTATESDAFCGLLCHPNEPEYVTHQISPHANVECGVCHVGPGLMPKVMAKIYGTQELYRLVTDTYERPIALPVDRLRPAEEICEQCHWPAKPYPDRVRLVSRSAEDEDNSESLLQYVLRLSPGPRADGAGSIHWHVTNRVLYAARDPLRQDIPWVAAVRDDGTLVEYVRRGEGAAAEEVATLPQREMDYLDCHNRATHQFRDPAERVDAALAAGALDRDLPYLKREVVRLLRAPYATQEEGLTAMEALAGFYRSTYPDVYAAREESIREAVRVTQGILRETVFPEMNLNWLSYPDNLGHAEGAGCFRCHDGDLVSAEGVAIPSDCTLCHSMPATLRPEEAPGDAPVAALPTGTEAPAIAHLVAGTSDCLTCHAVDGSLPAPDSHASLTADACTQCHAAPGSPVAVEIPHVVEERSNCLICHGEEGLRPAPPDHAGRPNEFCALCHLPREDL